MKQKKLFNELRNTLDQAWIQATKPISDLSLAQTSLIQKEMDGRFRVSVALQMRHSQVNEIQNKIQSEMYRIAAL
jgi:hypothetical protein